MDTFKCDGCGEPTPKPHQFEYLSRSAPGHIAAVMWFCGTCGPMLGAQLHTDDCEHD
jgi:hypothetical protein